jgi:hypothetical protein
MAGTLAKNAAYLFQAVSSDMNVGKITCEHAGTDHDYQNV